MIMCTYSFFNSLWGIMENFLITGGRKLSGSLKVPTSKNAVLPIIAGAVLTDEPVTIFNVPNLTDIHKMLQIYASLGGEYCWQNDVVTLKSKGLNNFVLPQTLTKDIRASVFMLGSLLARFKKAIIYSPGGCKIGARPIDIHLSGLKSLGVKITENQEQIVCDGSEMKSGTVEFRQKSVGATENLIMSSVFLKGTTTLKNCAREPEIVDLANFLNSMGAKVFGAGTDEIKIEGVNSLNQTEYYPIADRIIAGTYIIAVLMSGGNVELCYQTPNHIKSLLTKLSNCACNIDIKNDKIKIQSNHRPKSIKRIITKPYPNFPTDLQSPIMALQTICEGSSKITETVFESRFKQVPELIKMGADIKVDGTTAYVNGVERLHGAKVFVTDLRAGASLVLAGLNANGITEVVDVSQIDRGYERLEDSFLRLNALIERVKV